MKLNDAMKLHNGDEVIVKRTKTAMKVVEVETLTKEMTANNMACVSVMLDDGNWYGYKEIR